MHEPERKPYQVGKVSDFGLMDRQDNHRKALWSETQNKLKHGRNNFFSLQMKQVEKRFHVKWLLLFMLVCRFMFTLWRVVCSWGAARPPVLNEKSFLPLDPRAN